MNLKKYLLPFGLLCLLIFSITAFIFLTYDRSDPHNRIEGIETSYAFDLNADITIQSVTNIGDGVYRVIYHYFIANNTAGTVHDITATNDLVPVFGEMDYTISSISSDDLTLNSNFDGDSDTTLLIGNDSLNSGENGRIEVAIDFTPGENKGPFENNISVLAIKEPESGPGDSGSNDSSEGGDSSNGGDSSGGSNDGGTSDNSGDTDYSNIDLKFWVVTGGSERVVVIDDNDVIDFGEVGNFSVEGQPNMSFTGSMKITIENTGASKIDNQFKYIYSVDNLTNLPWNLENGEYTLMFEVYSESNLQGTKVLTKEITFSVDGHESAELEDEASISFVIEEETDNTGDSDSNTGDTNEDINNGGGSKPREDEVPPLLESGDEGTITPPITNEEEKNDVPITINDSNSSSTLSNTGIELRKSVVFAFILCLFVMDLEFGLISKKLFQKVFK